MCLYVACSCAGGIWRWCSLCLQNSAGKQCYTAVDKMQICRPCYPWLKCICQCGQSPNHIHKPNPLYDPQICSRRFIGVCVKCVCTCLTLRFVVTVVTMQFADKPTCGWIILGLVKGNLQTGRFTKTQTSQLSNSKFKKIAFIAIICSKFFGQPFQRDD